MTSKRVLGILPATLFALLVVVAVVAVVASAADAAKRERLSLPAKPIADFTLPSPQGAEHRFSEEAGQWTVVAFLGTECPLAKLYGPRLNELQTKFEQHGVVVIGIDSNSQDSMTEVAAYVRIHELDYLMLKDPGNEVADLFTAERTPEVFVLDHDRRIRYRGRIDDQYGVGYVRPKPTTHDLDDALTALLAGREPPRAVTEPVGCVIGRVRKPDAESDVTYSGQIAAIMQKHCVECHREGEIAPFTLTEYEDVASWSETIAEVVADQRMPPWHADPGHGKFENARAMSDAEKKLLYQWVEAGAPLGNPEQVPRTPDFPEVKWRLGRQPDQVVAMRDRPYVVPSQGTVEYQYYIVDPEFTEDKWIKAAEIMPGNRSVVHHAIVFFRAPEGVRQRGLGWLTAYVPGQTTLGMGEGLARRIPAGSKLIFQMHYTPAGSPQEDITKVGMVFADPQEVKEEVVTIMAINNHFEIPPHASDFPVEAELRNLPPNGRLLAVAPHMHVRGRSFRVEAMPRSKDSGLQSSVLLDVPRYDFNWQHVYQFEEPLPLKDFYLRCRATFDNSEDNLVNPDPNITVRWGDQTWQEMMVAFCEVALPLQDVDQLYGPRPLTAKQRQRAAAVVDRLMKKLDLNEDGIIEKKETKDGNAFLVFAFHTIDANRDGEITREEALQHALKAEREKRNKANR